MEEKPRLLDYKATATIGVGAFGSVYKVETNGKVFAMKHITLGGSSHRDMIQREVEVHQALAKHPNVLQFVDYFKSKFRWYIIVEFCELGTLESYLISNELDQETCQLFMTDMVRGLDHLHSNNIIHRDLKPENILLSTGSSGIPVCKLCDFGSARFVSQKTSETSNGKVQEDESLESLCGTWIFLAPEVLNRKYTRSCDIFSLGIVFYLLFARTISEEMRLLPWALNGTPFYKATDAEIQTQLSKFIPDKKMFHLIASMLTVDSKKRPTASELSTQLNHLEAPDDEVFAVFCVLFVAIVQLFVLPFPLAVIVLFMIGFIAYEFLHTGVSDKLFGLLKK